MANDQVSDHLIHPFGVMTVPETAYVDIVGGEGAWVWDHTGQRYLDGMASLWYCQIGYGRTEMRDAITDQLDKIAAYNVFAPFTNDPAREFARLVVERSPLPGGRVMLGCSGSEAVDTALKLARMYQIEAGRPDKQIIVRRTHGYHGTTYGGTSVQGIEANRLGWGELLSNVIEVPSGDIEAAATVFAEHGDRIAAIISEPVQGAGGVHLPPDGYLEGLRRMCDQHDALLIFDEVICGFGRTGSWFGAQTYGVTPDMMTFAKGATSGYLPLSGVVVSASVAEGLASSGEMLRHGYTYSGHPTACAAGIANIGVIESDGLIDRAVAIGDEVSAGLEALRGDGLISSSRGVAAVWAAEIGRDAIAVRDRMRARGVIVRGVGETIIFCPPLVIDSADITLFIEVLATELG